MPCCPNCADSSVAIFYHDGVFVPDSALADFWALPHSRARLLPETYLSPAELLANATVSHGASPPRLDHCAPCWGSTVLAMYNDQGPPIGQHLDLAFDIPAAGRYSLYASVLHWRGYGLWSARLLSASSDASIGASMNVSLSTGISFFGQVSSPATTSDWPETYQDGTTLDVPLGTLIMISGRYRLRFQCIGSNPVGFRNGRFGQAFGMGIDGIAIRKMLVDDPWIYMRQYQTNYTAIQTRKANEARNVIEELEAAVHKWSNAHGGQWPRSLASAVGIIPHDPWQQQFLYAVPGKCNPLSFDIWSRRGQSREPGRMLGNWNLPFAAAGYAVEGEDMTVSNLCQNCAARVVNATGLNVRGAPISKDQFLQLNFSAANVNASATLRFALPNGFELTNGPFVDLFVLYSTSPYYSTCAFENSQTPFFLSGFEEERGRDVSPRAVRVPVHDRSIELVIRAVGGPPQYGLGIGFGVDAVVLVPQT
jgi:hypothetical protein